jgi:hypothetical protein
MIKYTNNINTVEELQAIINNLNIEYFGYKIVAGISETNDEHVPMNANKLAYIVISSPNNTTKYSISLNVPEYIVYQVLVNAIGENVKEHIKNNIKINGCSDPIFSKV